MEDHVSIEYRCNHVYFNSNILQIIQATNIPIPSFKPSFFIYRLNRIWNLANKKKGILPDTKQIRRNESTRFETKRKFEKKKKGRKYES